MNLTIFLDGGCRPNPGPGASAITLKSAEGFIESHSRFYPHVTNNICEFIALLASLRLAHRILERINHVNIVADSECALKALLGTIKTTDKKLLPIIEMCIATFLPIASKVTICQMRRADGNYADKHATEAINMGKGTGDQNLFIDPPVLPPMPRVIAPQPSQPYSVPTSTTKIPSSTK